ncbi:MAG: YARHG domain-containing protein, partial [Chitinophagaceae bacterium]
ENDKYYKDGKYITAEWPKKDNGNADDYIFDYKYVYHFKAHFKKGLNKIIHTYRFACAGSVEFQYDLTYVLTAAMRWGNKQIDDFTLNIDVGDFQTLYIDQTFFKSHKDWLLIGKGNHHDNDTNAVFKNAAVFNIQKGTLCFQKLNFKTSDELFLFAFWPIAENNWEYVDTFNMKTHQLVFSIINQPKYAKDESSLKILKNLPYARRGYVFKTKELQDYFSKMSWYSPDPAYIATLSELTDEEQKWLKVLKI